MAARKQGPAKKFWKRAALPVALAALTAAGSHVMLKNTYGPSYPKRAPLVGRLVRQPHQLDFYLSRHLLSSDLKGLEGVLEAAKKEGKPYNVMVVEGAHATADQNRAYEARANKWVRQISDETAKMHAAKAEIKAIEQAMHSAGKESVPHGAEQRYADAKRRLQESKANLDMLDKREAMEDKRAEEFYKSGQRMALRDAGSDGFSLRQHKLAAQYGLQIRTSEGWKPEEAQEMKDLLRSALNPPESLSFEQQKRYTIGRFAEYMRRRNENIAGTMRQLQERHNTQPASREPLRAVVIFGSEHGSTADFVDRTLMSNVRIVHEEKGMPAERQYEEFYQAMNKARELSKRPMREIKKYQNGVGKR